MKFKWHSTFIKTRIRKAIADYPTMVFDFRDNGYGFISEFSYVEQKESSDRVGNRVGDNLTENQRLILKNMEEQPFVSAAELGRMIHISQRKVEKNISILKQRGEIRRVGSPKKGYWEVLHKK